MLNKKFYLGLFLVLIVFSCSKENITTPCDITNTTYTGEIKLIIDNHCAYEGCHASNSGSNNFDYTTYNGIKKGIGSFVDRLDRGIDDPLHMPQGVLLDDCEKKKIKAWVFKGGPYN